jgi:hypothetical protein
MKAKSNLKINKQGLQRLTENKLNKIFEKKKITQAEVKKLSKVEYELFAKMITEKFNALEGDEKEIFWNKIEDITGELTKNQVWEYNNSKITIAISTLMQQYGRMPSKTELAEETKLSRTTIHKHLKEFGTHPLYLEEMEQYKFMASKVLTKVFSFAVNGDVLAAKLFFNVVGNLNNTPRQKNTLIQNQNNYIQINGMVLSQEVIERLSPEQICTIESILIASLNHT